MSATLFDDLKAAVADEWQSYIHHSFVEQLGTGTLPKAAFQDYLVQDYLFLTQFARAYALQAYKSRTLGDIRVASDGLALILQESELHVRLCAGWGIDRDALDAAAEKDITVAYTRFVLDAGLSGDLLDLAVALAPCTVGYAEIGSHLVPHLHADHPYREWITEYAGAEFQAGAQEAIAHMATLGEQYLTPTRFDDLVEVFRTATRLEASFWQQALDDLS